MADHEVVAPMTLVAPFIIVVVAPMTLTVPFVVTVLAPMTLIAPLQITVIAPMTLIYELPTPQCTVDDDCPIGYVCENGVCVPENGNGPNGEETGWDRFLKWVEENWAVAAGGTFLVSAAILLWPGGKKK